MQLKIKKILLIKILLSKERLAKLIINGNNKGFSPLMTLLSTNYSSSDHQDLIKLFLEIPNIDINYSYTPRTFISKPQLKSALIIACDKKDETLINILLEHPKIEINECIDYLI